MKTPHVIVAGERWFKFFSDFRYSGKTYSFNFFARNHAEAVEILRAIRTTAVECHQIEGEISARVPGAGMVVKALCAIRNLFWCLVLGASLELGAWSLELSRRA